MSEKLKLKYKFDKNDPDDNLCEYYINGALKHYKFYKKGFIKKYPNYKKAHDELGKQRNFYNSFVQSCLHDLFMKKAIKKKDKVAYSYHYLCKEILDETKVPLSDKEKKAIYKTALKYK